MSTFVPSGKDISRKWYVVDASGQTLGRLATRAAMVLSGKTNPQYVPYIDMGDHVIVINAEKVRLTGLKDQKKLTGATRAFPAGCARSRSRGCSNASRKRFWKRRSKACCPRPSWGAPWDRS